MEGTPVAVMGSEEVFIDNESSGDDFWNDFNHRKITVIYLMNSQESTVEEYLRKIAKFKKDKESKKSFDKKE